MGIGIALALGGAALSAFGSIKQGKAAKKAAQYQAEVARKNAQIAVDFGEYNSAVARNNAISARYNAETAIQLGDRNANTVAFTGERDAQTAIQVGEINSQVLGVLGEYSAFVSEQRGSQATQRASIAVQKAAFRRQQQQQVIEQAQRRITERRIETRQLVGSQRAQLAANGVVVDEGSAASVVASTYEIGRRDQVSILANADIDIFDLNTQAYNFGAEALLLNQEAANHGVASIVKRYETSAQISLNEFKTSREVSALRFETADRVAGIQYEAAVRAYDFEREALNFDDQAVFVKYKAKAQATGFEADANLALARGKSAQTAGYLGAGATILGGVSNYLKATA